MAKVLLMGLEGLKTSCIVSCINRCMSISFYIEITKTKIDKFKNQARKYFNAAKTIPKTPKMHSVQVVDNSALKFRYYSASLKKHCKILI